MSDEELRKEIAYKVLEYYKGTAPDLKRLKLDMEMIYTFIKKFML